MKLTKFHKEAFVSAVMADVPKIDYQALIEVAVHEDVVRYLPDVFKEPYKDLKLRPFLHSSYHDSYRPSCAGLYSITTVLDYVPTKTGIPILEKLKKQATSQYDSLNDIRSKVAGTIEACSTVKMAREMMPKFEKYLPVEPVKGTILPAISNVVADLIKMGWPDKNKTSVGV
jgi:hypothetical protein